MTNNMMGNINKNKLNISDLEAQYSSGKKIQRPSDDPIVAVRALRLRTNVSEIEQYFNKNVPDAMSWMDITESALTTVNSILGQINTYCVQGSSDSLTASDRNAIAINLQEMKDQIYQEGNANYAGRYVFTGYKTDSSLVFNEDTDNLKYTITENFTGKDIQFRDRVINSYEVSDFDGTTTFDQAPQIQEVYRMQLSYENLDAVDIDKINYSVLDGNGVAQAQAPITNIARVSSLDKDAYNPADDEVHFIAETGELIFGKNTFEQIKDASNISVSYDKTNFSNGELKPEHYFDTTRVNLVTNETVTFKKEKQEIQYEVNYNQKLTVNTEGSEAISHKVGREIEDIINAVNDVTATEVKITEIKRRMSEGNLNDTVVARYEKMLEQLDTELVLKKEVMQQAFSNGITVTNKEQDRVNAAVADLGSRYVRLELTENRLADQKVSFQDLMSINEDADTVETYVRFTSAQSMYNASLNAAGKVVKNSLLDFI